MSTPETTPDDEYAATWGRQRNDEPPVVNRPRAYPVLPVGLGLLLAGQALFGFGIARAISDLSSYSPDSQLVWFILGALSTIAGAYALLVGVARVASHVDDLHLALLRPAPDTRH